MDQNELSRKVDKLLRRSEGYYKPWEGNRYRPGGLLVLSESAYCWGDGHPRPTHPTRHTVEHSAFRNFADRKFRYVTALTRALCNEQWPNEVRTRQSWNGIAYSIYIQRPLANVQSRPTKDNFIESGPAFIGLIERLKPSRVVITGYQVWDSMPETHVQIDRYKQAYRLRNGRLVWCLAVPHVQSRKEGRRFRWDEVGIRIQKFVQEQLPKE